MKTAVLLMFMMLTLTANVDAEEGEHASLDLGVLHFEVGTASNPDDGSVTTIVEGGFRTGVYNERMRVEDTLNFDGSRDVQTTHERSFLGDLLKTESSDSEHIPAETKGD